MWGIYCLREIRYDISILRFLEDPRFVTTAIYEQLLSASNWYLHEAQQITKIGIHR